MKLGLTLAAGALAALLLAPSTGFAQAADDTSDGTTTLVIIEQINPEQQTVIDLGEPGESQGDMIVFTGSLSDPEGTASGKSSGFCITTDVEEKLSECVWTYHFAEGSITIAGTEPDLGANTEIHMPIVGGTGDYAGARGLIHEQHNEDLTIFTTTIELIDDSPALESIVDYWNSDIAWSDISEEEQAAWNVLGWNEMNWDNDDPTTIPASETTAWEGLTEEEQTAATTLGYDEESWAEIQARIPEGDVDEFWIAEQWDDLKYSEKRLWGILGWNAENWVGDDPTIIPASETTAWGELTEEEQAAAAGLGYDEESWTGIQARVPEGDVGEFWSAQAWDDLKYSEKRLWGLLGWNAESWEGNSDEPDSSSKSWADLTPEEQAAATHLGYTEESWDAQLP